MLGVATVARDGPWMAGPRRFLANGFETVATAPADYQLLARKFDGASPDPQFRPGREKALARYGRGGLTIMRAAQCPYAVKFARDAQKAPTPYATFALVLDGRVVADHPISRTRFRNTMRSVAGPGPM
jgi:hypothetical protein